MVDTRGLGRLIGIYSYINGGLFIVGGILYGLGLEFGMTIPYIFLIISSFLLIIRSQRYTKAARDLPDNSRWARWQYILTAGILIFTIVFVSVLFYFSTRPTKVTFLEEGLKIHGMYGQIYLWEDIEEVEIMEELPIIEAKTNGASLGSHRKGHFRVKDLGPVKLFVNTSKPPFIYLETNNKPVIFNMEDIEETESLFQKINSRLE